MPFTAISQFAELFVERLVLCLLGGTLIASFAMLLLRFGRFGSRLRYLVWWSALASAALLLVPQVAPSTGHNVAASAAPLTLPGRWATYAFGLWVLGALFGLARLVFGALRIQRLRRGCTRIAIDELSPEVREIISASSRQVSVCMSGEVTVPCALGFFHPTVVIPSDLLARLSEAELKQVLIHEIAHIHFWDDWSNLAQKFLRAILFFHPAAWFIDRKLAAEREMACDDFVVQQTGDTRAYARCLTSLAEISLVRRTAALVQAALGRRSQTSARVTRLLGNPTALHYRMRPALSVAGVILVTAFSIRSFTPTLVGFTNPVHSPAEIAKHIETSVKQNATQQQVTARPQLAAFRETRTAPAMAKKKKVSTPRAEAGHTMLAKTASPRNPQLMLATAKAQAAEPTLHVQQTYFAVVDSDYDGVQSVSIYQLTVWHVAPARNAKPADHKTT